MKKYLVLSHIISGTFAASFVLYFVKKNTAQHNAILSSIYGTQLLSWIFRLISLRGEKKGANS